MNGQPKNDADYASGNDFPQNPFVSPEQLPSSHVSSNRYTTGIPVPPNLDEPRTNSFILPFRESSYKSPDRKVGVATNFNEHRSEGTLSPTGNLIECLLEGSKIFLDFPSSADAPLVSPAPKKTRYGSSSVDPEDISDRMGNNETNFTESATVTHYDWRNVEKPNVDAEFNFQSTEMKVADQSSSEIPPFVSPPRKISAQYDFHKAEKPNAVAESNFQSTLMIDRGCSSGASALFVSPTANKSPECSFQKDISDREYVTGFNENDFFCGRGGDIINRPGNKLVHKEKMLFYYQHRQAGDLFEKDRVAQSFIKHMREKHGTRFLDYDVLQKQKKWYIIDEKRTSKIVKAILRTAKPE